jgi:(R,R)-butanediol dehydrogenase/meso-butanediol dehydrogenase/diacetyl reductase
MQALVYHGIRDIRYEKDWPVPPAPPPGEVQVATSWAGICGSDLEDYQFGGVIPREKPHPTSGRMAPLILGHELAGRVTAVGAGVTNVRVGQRVAVEPVRVCRECEWCGRSEYAACANFVTIGQMDDGGMADLFNAPAENCIPVADHVSDELAALAEPFAVMLHAMGKGGVRLGSTVTIVGAGPIGLSGIAAARVAGAGQVIAVTRGGKRAEVAGRLGASAVLDSGEANWRNEFDRLTRGRGSDVVIDCGGSAEAMKLALALTRRHGRMVLNSVVDRDIALPGLDILLHEKEIVGSVAHSYDREFAWAVNYLASGQVDLSPMITGRVHLSEAVARGFDTLLARREEEVKILVTPEEELVEREA